MPAKVFVDYLEYLFRLSAGKAAFVLDNAPAHLAFEVRDQISRIDTGQSIHFLPPNASGPMLNIAEHSNTTFKAVLKRNLEEARPALLQIKDVLNIATNFNYICLISCLTD